MADVDADAVAALVAPVVGQVTGPDDRTRLAVAAALDWCARYTGVPVADIQDDALTVAGLVVLSARILQDTQAGGATAPDGFPAIIPEDIGRHVHHYFDPIRVETSWGVA